MSEHVRERLSAYLDRELAADDADAVLAHLRGCEACQSHLAALTSLDKVARALPVEAPAGYFDTLPGRVRARLEATSSRPAVARLARPAVRPPLRRLPAWTWAVAAALLLAVVVPITLRETQSLAPPTRPVVTPAVPAPQATLKEPEAYSEGTPAPAEDLPRAAPEKLSREGVAGRRAGVRATRGARGPDGRRPPRAPGGLADVRAPLPEEPAGRRGARPACGDGGRGLAFGARSARPRASARGRRRLPGRERRCPEGTGPRRPRERRRALVRPARRGQGDPAVCN